MQMMGTTAPGTLFLSFALLFAVLYAPWHLEMGRGCELSRPLSDLTGDVFMGRALKKWVKNFWFQPELRSTHLKVNGINSVRSKFHRYSFKLKRAVPERGLRPACGKPKMVRGALVSVGSQL